MNDGRVFILPRKHIAFFERLVKSQAADPLAPADLPAPTDLGPAEPMSADPTPNWVEMSLVVTFALINIKNNSDDIPKLIQFLTQVKKVVDLASKIWNAFNGMFRG
ncbi:unnamed protein product [Cuscuta europaea]|uniref:Uncharacterized protein n=1 Tax=Cuscuta europaea TaxID=41803 RepID=A0A9P1E0K9_CUSEU|nr:unnamed protein product [Cuscuta europaea]